MVSSKCWPHGGVLINTSAKNPLISFSHLDTITGNSRARQAGRERTQNHDLVSQHMSDPLTNERALIEQQESDFRLLSSI